MTPRQKWSYETGKGDSRVVVEEARGGILELRWWDNTKSPPNWTRRSLSRRLDRDARGRPTTESQNAAIADANQKSLELTTGTAAKPVVRTALRIDEAEALVIHKDFGKYPHDSPRRRELVRAIRLACVVWGPSTTFVEIEENDFTKLLRHRLDRLLKDDRSGWRATEITISCLITVVRWLRRKKFIPRDAAPWPDDWKDEIKSHWKGVKGTSDDPEPDRPRHTAEEAIAILNASTFDPRFNLLMWSGMELRLGQVARTRRSDVVLPPVDWNAPIDPANDETDYGTMEIKGAGKKRGTIIALARGQRAMLEYSLSADGYLGELEARYQRKELPDYRLFPAGYICGRVGNNRGKANRLTLSPKVDPQKHCTSSWVRKTFREAERRAGVEHVPGRGAYGIRRGGVDFASADLSPAGLKNWGGWFDIKMPEQVYKENENKAGAREARAVRARFRGGLVPHFDPQPEGE